MTRWEDNPEGDYPAVRTGRAVAVASGIKLANTDLKVVITGGTVESVERQIPKEMDKWAHVVKDSGAKLN